jgi:Tfp pilus assembly protein PilF
LKKAVTLAPKDEFSHTTLGIVYYRQSKFDEALAELTKSLAINPKSATAHNYLGITASQKGWQEAAEKEMLEAIADNPDYADAHFNLAVIYATATPPAKELAKRHYVRATSLGAQPDPSLEKLLH